MADSSMDQGKAEHDAQVCLPAPLDTDGAPTPSLAATRADQGARFEQATSVVSTAIFVWATEASISMTCGKAHSPATSRA